jgi:dihydrofolate reductase
MKIGSIPTKIPSVKTVVSSIDNLLQRCRENDRKENIIYGSGFIVDRRHEITDKWMS